MKWTLGMCLYCYCYYHYHIMDSHTLILLFRCAEEMQFLNFFISDLISLRSSPTALGSWEGKILNMSVNDVSISSSLNSFWVTPSCLGHQGCRPFPVLLTKNGVNLNGRWGTHNPALAPACLCSGVCLVCKALAPSKHSMSIIIIVATADQDPLTRKAKSTAWHHYEGVYWVGTREGRHRADMQYQTQTDRRWKELREGALFGRK